MGRERQKEKEKRRKIEGMGRLTGISKMFSFHSDLPYDPLVRFFLKRAYEELDDFFIAFQMPRYFGSISGVTGLKAQIP